MLDTSGLEAEGEDDWLDSEDRKTQALISELRARRGDHCPGCQSSICGHVWIVNHVMGFKNLPRCLDCLSSALERQASEFLSRAISTVYAHDCYRQAWLWSSEQESSGDRRQPQCLQSGDSGSVARVPIEEAGATERGSVWDAGDMSCGDLVLELRLRLRALNPGDELLVISRDPGAPQDLPAWCRMTGHSLLRADHPSYLIRRRST